MSLPKTSAFMFFIIDSVLSEARICQSRNSPDPPSDSGNFRDKARSSDDRTGKTNWRKMLITVKSWID